MILLASWAAQVSGSVWVRIHHAAESLSTAGVDRTALHDYGSFQWGELPASRAAELQNRGLRLTVSENPFELTLGGKFFDPLVSESAPPASARGSADAGGSFHLVQFIGPIRNQWLQALRDENIAVAQPVHPFSYIVWATDPQVIAISSHASVRWVGPMRGAWKLQSPKPPSSDNALDTMMLVSAHVEESTVRAELASFGTVLGFSPVTRHFNVVHMMANQQQYSDLASLSFVYTVQYIRPETGPRGEFANQSIVGNFDKEGAVFPGYASWLSDTGFDGSGITVGIVDRGIRTSHVDLVDRMKPCRGANETCLESGITSHATHVAGAVAGTAATDTLLNGFLRGQGVAPGASLVNQVYLPLTDKGSPGGLVPDGMLRIFEDSARSGALLTNNSWGPADEPQGYDIPTQQVDIITRDADPDTPGQQPILAIWAVMNGNGDGTAACAPSSLGSPDEAKNLLAVSSTWLQTSSGDQRPNVFSISSNAAHGNACDGRRVPHIVAPGCHTDSTTAASDTAHGTNFCGTSFAAPVVSGAIALWAEQRARSGALPSPALAKAVFTAAAKDLAGSANADGELMGHRPDRFQGFGRLELDRVMNGPELLTFDQQHVFTATGQTWDVAVQAVDDHQPIHIMLAWTDAPGHGLGGTTPAWVNNLDLVVQAGPNTYLGNFIGADGWSATGGRPDGINNLEGVFLNPEQHAAGLVVTVTASDLAGDALNPHDPQNPRQDFALACFNCQPGDLPEPQDHIFKDRFESQL